MHTVRESGFDWCSEANVYLSAQKELYIDILNNIMENTDCTV